MQKYIYNSNIIGYEQIELKEEQVDNITDSCVIIIVEKDEDNKGEVYRSVRKLSKRRNKVTLIGVEKNETFKMIATMLTSIGNNNIYIVEDRDVITVAYLEAIEEREPDFKEVQNFIGGDVTSYAITAEMLMKIENIVEDGDMEQLSEFVQDNRETLMKMSTSIDLMRTTAELTNSEELTGKIEELSKMLEKAEEDLEDARAELERNKSEQSEITDKEKEISEEREELIERVRELEEQVKNGTSVINCYQEITLAYVKHNIKRILYFKELTYVNYVGSFVDKLYSMLVMAHKLNTKLVIYDNNTDMYDKYVSRGITVVNSKNYASTKNTLVGTNTCVISEPNQSITNEMLTSSEDIDVLIIYDKMHRYANVVSANIMTRLFITPSSNELNAVRKKCGLNVNDMIITRQGSSILSMTDLPNKSNIICLKDIPSYAEKTESWRVSMYGRETGHDGVRLFDKIMSVSKINTLLEK